jgi:hypothetical protein
VKLQPPRPVPPKLVNLFYAQQCPAGCGITIKARGNWKSSGACEDWVAVVEWIKDPENLCAPNGQMSKFYFRRYKGWAKFQFSQPDVGFAFKMRFG